MTVQMENISRYSNVIFPVHPVKFFCSVCLSNDPHEKGSANSNARWNVNLFSLLQLVISLA